jgi:hypothetical protein
MPVENDPAVKYYRGFNDTKVGHCLLPLTDTDWVAGVRTW